MPLSCYPDGISKKRMVQRRQNILMKGFFFINKNQFTRNIHYFAENVIGHKYEYEICIMNMLKRIILTRRLFWYCSHLASRPGVFCSSVYKNSRIHENFLLKSCFLYFVSFYFFIIGFLIFNLCRECYIAT